MIKTIDECFFLIQNGANIKQGDTDGGFPITRIETTANDKFNRDRMGYAGITDISKYESYVLEDGDLLMSHINSVQYLGRTVLYVKQQGETIIHGMNLLRLKARRDVINPAYARYCFYGHPFRSQVGNITKKSVNQASFAVKDLKRIKIDIPTVSEQNEIVMILDKVQQVIDLRTYELSKLDDLIKARFVEMFGDPRNNSHYEYVSFEELVEYMGDIGSNGANKVVTEHLDMTDEEDYALMVRFLNFTKNDFTDDVKYISKEAYEFFKKSQIFGGELIICKIGSAGQNYVMPNLNRPVSLGLNQIMVRINNKVEMPYLYQYLHTEYGEHLISGCINGAVTKSITKTELKKIPVMLPPKAEQMQFVSFVEQVDKSKVAIQNLLDENQILYDSLMQHYFE